MSMPKKSAPPLARRIPLGQLIIEREGALSIECTSLRRTVAAQQKQMTELREKLRASLAREAGLRRRCITLSEKAARAAGEPTPQPAHPKTETASCSS